MLSTDGFMFIYMVIGEGEQPEGQSRLFKRADGEGQLYCKGMEFTGLYWLFSVDIDGARLVEGDNIVFLTQPRSTSPFQGIMYDYIRLEGPPSSSSTPSKLDPIKMLLLGNSHFHTLDSRL